MKKNLRHLRNLRDKNNPTKKKSVYICEICGTKKTIKREHNVPISSDHHHQMSCHNQTAKDQYF